MELLWLIPAAAVAAVLVAVLVAVLLVRRRSERRKCLHAAHNLIQEELLDNALGRNAGRALPARRLMLYLCANTDPPKRTVFDPARGVLIGRGNECNVCVRDANVSQEHCRIFLRKGQVFVQDLDSVNGTWVRRGWRRRWRVKPEAPFPLQSGDRLLLGSVTLRVTLFPFDDATM